MPQISPMNWTLIIISFSFILLLTKELLPFYKIQTNKTLKMNPTKKSLTW